MIMMMMMIVDLYSLAHYAERLYCATCPGALWKEMSSVLIEKIDEWVSRFLTAPSAQSYSVPLHVKTKKIS